MGKKSKRKKQERRSLTKEKEMAALVMDPNAPKRACSAYLHYASAVRPIVEQDFPELSFGEKQKKIAEKFKQLTKDEKAKYEDMAAKDRERYEREMENYTPPSDDSDSDSDYYSDVPLRNLKEKEAGASAKDHAALLDEREQHLDFHRKIDKAFADFLLWSLSDKDDLTPKKFEKMTPRFAQMLLDDEDFTFHLLNSREKAINSLEEQIKERWYEFNFTEDFDIEEGVKILMKLVKLGSEEDEAQFRQDFEQIAERRKTDMEADMETSGLEYMDPIDNMIFPSFQEVAYKWTKSQNACLDRIFYNLNNFGNFFQDKMFAKMLERKDGKLLQKFYLHPSARKQELKDELEQLLFSVLTLYQELNRCCECKKLDRKTLLCASCKCATYCSRECQVKHWKEGGHKEGCEVASRLWSTYKRRKKRVEKALYRDKRVYTKPIKVNGIEKECFLRPCETLDSYLCPINAGINNASMDNFYKNMAKLACGGKHVLFGNDTISPQLEKKIQNSCEFYNNRAKLACGGKHVLFGNDVICPQLEKKLQTTLEDVIFEIDPKTLKEDEITAMECIVDKLMYPETKLARDDLRRITRDLSVDRFITIYICVQDSQIFGNKFEIEKDLLQEFKCID